MYKSYIKLFFRNLFKNKVLSSINFIGFVVGVLSTLLILEYVQYERSYESFHENSDRIYRVAYSHYKEGKLLWEAANSFFPTGRYLKENFDEVENFFTYKRNYEITLSFKDELKGIFSFNVDKAYYITPTVFDMLSFKIIKGGFERFDEPNTLMISEKAAEMFFGSDNPLGKVISLNHRDDFTVIGVYQNLPSNTHFKSDYLFSMATVLKSNPGIDNNWYRDGYTNYLMLKPGVDYTTFYKKAFPKLIADNYAERLKAGNLSDDFYLLPIRDIHLKSNVEWETEPPGSDKALSVLFIFAIFFIVIAWVNYINLTSARAVERAAEIGVKKVFGTTRKALIRQFIFETFLFNIICLGISVLLFVLINPIFKELVNISGGFSIYTLNFWGYALIFVLVGIILSSIYPALVLTSYKPVAILKGKFAKTKSGMSFRKALVSFQFAVSLILLTGTIITYKQVAFLLNKDMGVNCHSKLVIKAPKVKDSNELHLNKIQVLKDKFLQYPEIEDFIFLSDIPGREISTFFGGFRKGTQKSQNSIHFRINADNNFNDFFNVNVIAGRGFEPHDLKEQKKIIVNEKAMERFGFKTPEEAVNNFIVTQWGAEFQIIGVVDDFHYYSVKVEGVPTVIYNTDAAKKFMVLKTTSKKDELVNRLKQEYESIFPDEPFDFFSLENYVQNDLRTDKTFVKVFSIFSLLAIFVAVIGVLGLVIITINQNMKELGVRKVHGANRNDFFSILLKNLVPEYMVAVVIAIPTSYYIFNYWVLDNYLYRINLNWSYFFVPIVLLIALFSGLILIQAVKAYSLNVVKIINIE